MIIIKHLLSIEVILRGSIMQVLLRIRDAAPMLKISEITLRRLIKRKEIPYHRIGYQYFFTDDDIKLYLSTVFVPIKDKNDENS